MTEDTKQQFLNELVDLLGRAENQLDSHYGMEFLDEAIDLIEKDRNGIIDFIKHENGNVKFRKP